MIISVPTFYAASVVLPGKRTECLALLAAQAHLRVPSPPDLGVALRISHGFLDEVASYGLHGNTPVARQPLEEAYFSESADSEVLLAPFRFLSPRIHDNRSEGITGQILEAIGARMVERGSQLGMICASKIGWPFQSPSVLGAAHALTPIYPEDTPFRSMRPVSDDARNIALAYAAKLASQLRADPAGMLYLPSAGPSLVVYGNQVLLDSPRQAWSERTDLPLRTRFRLDQVNEATAMADAGGHDKAMVENFSAEILRPAAYNWSPTLDVAVTTAVQVSPFVNSVMPQQHPDAWRLRSELVGWTDAIERATSLVSIGETGAKRTLLDAALAHLRCQRELLQLAEAEHGPRTNNRAIATYALAKVELGLALAEQDPSPRWRRPLRDAELSMTAAPSLPRAGLDGIRSLSPMSGS